MGREEALGGLVRAACSQRLVTLHGSAGVGKTALLRVAAARLAEAGAFPAGVYWVALRGVSHGGAAREAIVKHLTEGQDACLVVLDGPDQLPLAALARALLTRFPSLHLLIGSRQPCALEGESALFLPPLLPSDTRRLLVGWAGGGLDPDDTAALARLLEGNPQATRFVAVLLESESLPQLRGQLEKELMARALRGDEHDLALTTARDLVLARLPEAPRRLLGTLSLFALGAQAQDLEAVFGPGWQAEAGGLQRAGLLRVEEGRYQVAIDLPDIPPQASLGPVGLLLALALGHLRTGNVNAAFDLGERALTTARQTQSREGFARALLVLGMVTLQEDPARAVLLFEEAATHFESIGEPLEQAEARRWEGCALAQINEPEAALAALYESHKARVHPRLEALFTQVQVLLTHRGGGSLLAALSVDPGSIREGGLLAARVRLGLPGK